MEIERRQKAMLEQKAEDDMLWNLGIIEKPERIEDKTKLLKRTANHLNLARFAFFDNAEKFLIRDEEQEVPLQNESLWQQLADVMGVYHSYLRLKDIAICWLPLFDDSLGHGETIIEFVDQRWEPERTVSSIQFDTEYQHAIYMNMPFFIDKNDYGDMKLKVKTQGVEMKDGKAYGYLHVFCNVEHNNIPAQHAKLGAQGKIIRPIGLRQGANEKWQKVDLRRTQQQIAEDDTRILENLKRKEKIRKDTMIRREKLELESNLEVPETFKSGRKPNALSDREKARLYDDDHMIEGIVEDVSSEVEINYKPVINFKD
ncbi:putative movement protein [Lettuce dieback associated virus]|nr:putative movement protein [Lettuce dieback associated virus]